jgi:hypothetical protein
MTKTHKIGLISFFGLVISYTGVWFWQGQKIQNILLQELNSISHTSVSYEKVNLYGYPFRIGMALINPIITFKHGIITSNIQGSLSITRSLFSKDYKLFLSGHNSLQVLFGLKKFSHTDFCLDFREINGIKNISLFINELKDGETILLDQGSLDVNFMGDITKGTPKEMAQRFHESLGSLDVKSLSLRIGESKIQTSGTLVLDENLQPTLTATIQTDRLQSFNTSYSQALSNYIQDSKQPIPITLQGTEIIIGDKTFPNPVRINWDAISF